MTKQEPKQDANIIWEGVASIELYWKWYTSYDMLAEAANEMQKLRKGGKGTKLVITNRQMWYECLPSMGNDHKQSMITGGFNE